MLKFQGKTALITGSGTGIGRAIAMGFAKSGASVIILGRRKGPLDEAAKELEAAMAEAGSGASVKSYPGVDVSDEAGINGMYEDMEGSGVQADYVINNAGVSGPVMCFAHAGHEDFRSTVAIHLSGTFWTSVRALPVMAKGAKIITISTFFTEERPLEQRPYRFRSPYTAAQGAKNRLAEALSWELASRGIASIATNPGPVHSDRIYKTVYPKAAAEFMRVGGYGSMGPQETEAACAAVLGLLGEGEGAVKAGIAEAAGATGQSAEALGGLLEKIAVVAEKIQANTSSMIADRQFLSQDQVAETVLNLCDDSTAATLNGKVIPGDRVFYPVKPHVAGAAPPAARPDLSGKAVFITSDARTAQDAKVAAGIAAHAEECGAKAVCIAASQAPEEARAAFSAFHSHEADLSDPAQIRRWAQAASKIAPIGAAVHVTGSVPDADLTALSRAEWDSMVDRFVNAPALAIQSALESLVPGGGDDPRLFAGKAGSVMIVGPALPAGKKVTGAQRARAEVFRGALRPLATTVNQELSDVLKSRVRAFLALGGTAGGAEPSQEAVNCAFDYFCSGDAASSAQVIFCVDESR